MEQVRKSLIKVILFKRIPRYINAQGKQLFHQKSMLGIELSLRPVYEHKVQFYAHAIEESFVALIGILRVISG